MTATGKHLGPSPEAGSSLRELADWVEQALDAAPLAFGHGTDNPRDEAVWLLLAALERSPVAATVDPEEAVDAAGIASVRALLELRVEERRPLAYLTGTAWFAGLAFYSDERALVPRSPLAEPIAERFDPWIDDRHLERILDIGTGNGCIAVACAYAFPEAHVDAVDVDADAIALAQQNIGLHGLHERVQVHRSDVFAGLPEGRQYDLIVSNPPYVTGQAMVELPMEYRHEPSHGLAGGRDGLAVVARILHGAPERLTPQGMLVVETGQAGEEVERRWPGLAVTWVAFDNGGEGVFVVSRAELAAADIG